MTNPMYCPMAFNNYTPNLTRCDGKVENQMYMFECTPDCAWAAGNEQNDSYTCAIAANAVYGRGLHPNTRPLKDDAK